MESLQLSGKDFMKLARFLESELTSPKDRGQTI